MTTPRVAIHNFTCRTCLFAASINPTTADSCPLTGDWHIQISNGNCNVFIQRPFIEEKCGKYLFFTGQT